MSNKKKKEMDPEEYQKEIDAYKKLDSNEKGSE